MVKVRAEAMQKASELVPSGMLSVIGRPQAQYKYACLQAKAHCTSQGIEEPVCSVANYLFPDGRVIAGNQEVWSIMAAPKSWVQNIFICLFYLNYSDINLCKSVMKYNSSTHGVVSVRLSELLWTPAVIPLSS